MTRPGEIGEETVGERLRRLRQEKSLSQRALAGPGISTSHISRIESGQRIPSIKILRLLAPKLGVSVPYLETGADERTAEAERELRLADSELRLRLGEDIAAAEAELRSLLAEAAQAGDLTTLRRAKLALGLALAQLGRYAETIEQLAGPLEAGELSPTTRPDVYLTLADAYTASKRHERAIELLETALAELERRAPADEETRVRFLTHLSYALADLGDFARAREALADIEEEREHRDPYSRIRIYWSLARLAAMEGDTQEALAHLRRAIVLLESTEDTLHQARAHLLCAEIMLADRRAAEAGAPLERAERLFELGSSARDLGAVRAQQAKRAAMLGEAAEAIAFAKEALGYLHEHPVEQASAHHALGLAYALRGEAGKADASFRRAVEGLRESGMSREAVQASQAWAGLLRSEGRHDEAIELLQQATELGLRGGESLEPR